MHHQENVQEDHLSNSRYNCKWLFDCRVTMWLSQISFSWYSQNNTLPIITQRVVSFGHFASICVIKIEGYYRQMDTIFRFSAFNRSRNTMTTNANCSCPIRKKSGDNPRCFGRIFLIRGNIPTINGDLTLQSKLEIRKGGDFQFTSRIHKFQSQISHDPL